MKCLTVCMLFLLATVVNAMDPPAIQWVTEYGGTFFDVRETLDGGFVVTGHRSTPADPPPYCLFKFTGSGDHVWSSGSDQFTGQVGRWVEQLENGNFIVTGSCGLPDSSTAAVMLFETDSNGTVLWSRAYDFPDSSDAASCVLPLSGGGFALCGTMDPVQPGLTNSFVMVTGAQGDSLWSMRFKRDYVNMAQRILEYEDQLIVFIHAPIYSTGKGGIRIFSFNIESGEILWEADDFPYELSYGYFEFFGGDMTISTTDEGYTFATAFFPNIAHTDALGNLEWNYEIPYYSYPYGHSISNTMDGGYIYGGENTPGPEPSYGIQTGLVVKYDSAGTMQWADIVWEIISIQSIRQLSSGGYIACGPVGTLIR